MRDEESYLVEVEAIVFNGQLFTQIMIPINHINFDRDHNQRSQFTVEEVADLVSEVLNHQELIPDGYKNSCKYFSYEPVYKGKSYKLVFNIRESEIVIEVLTLFRVGRS